MPLDIRPLRKFVNYCGSTTEAARRLDIHRESLLRLLRGDNTDIRLSTLEHLADVIGVAPGDLIHAGRLPASRLGRR